MQTVRKGGVRTVKLSAPEVRKLDDAAMLLKQIAIAIVDPDEIAHLNHTAQIVEGVVDDYTPSAAEKEAEKAEAQPPFAEKEGDGDKKKKPASV